MQTSDQSAALPLSNKTTIQSGPQHIINSGTRSMETMNANYLSNGSNGSNNGNDNTNSNGDGHGNGHTPIPMGHVLVSDPLAATAPLASDPGSDPSSSQNQHMVHEPTHAHASIIAPLQNASISDSSQGCGEPSLVENSTASSATAMSISRHDEWNQNRPTRESVLRRLSEALLRRSLTMVSYFYEYIIQWNLELKKTGNWETNAEFCNGFRFRSPKQLQLQFIIYSIRVLILFHPSTPSNPRLIYPSEACNHPMPVSSN